MRNMFLDRKYFENTTHYSKNLKMMKFYELLSKIKKQIQKKNTRMY